MEPQPPVAGPGLPAAPPQRPGSSVAPYAADPPATRQPLDAASPWREAGRSHLATAGRLLTEHRRTGGLVVRWRTPPEVAGLRARALDTYRPGLSSMHVTDLAMVVEDLCLPAPLDRP